MNYLKLRLALSGVITSLIFLILAVLLLSVGEVNALVVGETSEDTGEMEVSELEIKNEEEVEAIEGESVENRPELRGEVGTDIERVTDPVRDAPDMEGIEVESPVQIGGGEDGITTLEDDGDRIDTAQDYNSTRSNRRKNSFFNPDDVIDVDDDGDGIITVLEEHSLDIRREGPFWRCSVEEDTDSEGEVYCWGQGVRAVAIGEENNDGSVDTDTRVLKYLQVRANEVRSWSAEEKSALRAYSESEQGKNTPEGAAAVITEKVLDNEKIREMEVSDEGVRMRYRAEMKLFGLFSITREVDASVLESGKVDIDLPWYGFLSRKPDNSNIKEVLKDTMDILALVPGRTG